MNLKSKKIENLASTMGDALTNAENESIYKENSYLTHNFVKLLIFYPDLSIRTPTDCELSVCVCLRLVIV